jgi:competence protein ComEC
MMIDAGPKSSENLLVEYIRDNVKSQGNNHTIDYLILTHPDTDHSGGMCAIFKQFDIKHFYRPNIASKSEDVEQFTAICDINEYDEVINVSQDEKGLEVNIVNQNYDFNVGEVKVEIFAPIRVYSTTNSMSPVIKVSYLGKSFLFTGDIQLDAESDMLARYPTLLDADVLKVAHHGSDTSNSDKFIAQVSPKYAVISVDSPNSYGHPSYSTIVTLQKYNAQIIKTNETIVRFSLGDKGLEMLDEEVVISTVFIEWKVIAIILASVLLLLDLVLLIKLARFNNRLIIDK